MSENEKFKRKNTSINNCNTLSNLFKEYSNISSKKDLRLQSISYSESNDDNLRENILEPEINENEEFSQIITKKLDDIKNNSISKFQNEINKININYNNFKDKILNFISSKEKIISNVIEPEKNNKCILKYATQNIFKKLNTTIEICKNIINNIEKNFELLNIFFEENSFINSQKQVENFLVNNYKLIENCSLVNKFNFTELDTTNLNKIEYYAYYRKYLSQKKIEVEGIAKNYTIKKEDLQNGIRFILENFISLEKLQLEGVNNNDYVSILENIGICISRAKKCNLNKLNIKNFGTLDSKSENISLNQIQKLKIQKGNSVNISSISKLFIINNKNLISLSLEYVNMTDIGFNTLLLSLIKNSNITNTLEYLSLEGNRITMVKYDRENNKIQNQYFLNLRTLNLSKNELYKFDFSLNNNALPKLKFLDLSSNNIPTGSFMEMSIIYKNKLILLNDNMFITNNQENNIIYVKYLNERLPTFDYEINNLNLSFAYDIENQSYLEKLNLSINVTISLVQLDLSFCGLYTDVLVKFFNNNPKFLSLYYLNLRYNNLKGDFFEKILSNDEICFDNINFIDLSENEIVCESLDKLKHLENFIEKHNYLEKMDLINTGFLTDLIENIKDSNPNSEQFKDVLFKLKKNLEENKREFKFTVNEKNATFVKKEFQCFFTFRFS